MKARTYKAVFSFDVAKQYQPDGSCLLERVCITESLDIPLSGINVNFVIDDEVL